MKLMNYNKKNNTKTLVQYGAGNIGRGFIGQIFSEAGYEIQFIDVNSDVINALNSQRRYPIGIVSNCGATETWVENVSGIDEMDRKKTLSAISICDIMATAVGVNVLPRIVPNIVAGFRKRISIGNENPQIGRAHV